MDKDELQARLAGLSDEELFQVCADALIAHGADPETAVEVYAAGYMHPQHHQARTWAEEAAQAPETLRLYVESLKSSAKLHGVAPAIVDRLAETGFRHRVRQAAIQVQTGQWHPSGYQHPEHESYSWAWTLAQLGAGVDEEELTHEAYIEARHPGQWVSAQDRL